MDAEKFITSVIKSDLLERLSGSSHDGTLHVVMNLPSLAVEYLKCFRGLLSGCELRACLLPVVHCYSFSRADDPSEDVAQRAADAVGVTSFEHLQQHDVRVVRNVAPGKEMICVTFRLPWSVVSASNHGQSQHQCHHHQLATSIKLSTDQCCCNCRFCITRRTHDDYR